MALGEGDLWVASWDQRGGIVWRIDHQSGDLLTTVRVAHGGGDVATGAGAVWTAGVVCLGPHPDDPDVCLTQPRVSRIDPRSGEVAATIKIALPRGIRRDTAHVSAVAVGDDAVWITSPTAAHPGLAVRVDTHTNEVARERLPVDRFYPVAVQDDAIWFIGAAGRRAILARLDPRTLRQTSVTRLPISAVRAAHDPASDSFWIGSLVIRYNERVRLVRVQMR